MDNITNYNESVFESIKHIDENGSEFWYARELQKALEYKRWDKFCVVIDNAKAACIKSKYNVLNHISQVGKMVEIGSKTKRQLLDYKLSRYACYLIVQNSDPRKEIVALGQTYFAIQTRKQELMERDYETLTEDEKRFYQRNLTRKGNYSLNHTAKKAGVKNFDKFHNAGYRGLYNGETADDIAKRKGLRYREDILDNMCSDELIANLFRISQTNQKIKNNNISGENNCNMAHYNMGRDIRNFIAMQGGTMPENFPKPEKSLKELEKDRKFINLKV
jgi:DNA-damage-inducible protein D